MSANKDNPQALVSDECCVPKFCWHQQVGDTLAVELHRRPDRALNTHLIPTKTRAPISIEPLVALAEIRADDVATASVGVTAVNT